jgi:hypothetical protein
LGGIVNVTLVFVVVLVKAGKAPGLRPDALRGMLGLGPYLLHDM